MLEENFEEDLKENLKNGTTVIKTLDFTDLTMPDVLPKKPLTVTERYIAELYSLGNSNKKISEELGLPLTSVRRVLSKPDVSAFVTDLVNTQMNSIKEGRIRILNKVIDDKLEHIEKELDGDFSKATKKDIVDVVMALDSIMKEREKSELGTSDSTYINLIQQVVK